MTPQNRGMVPPPAAASPPGDPPAGEVTQWLEDLGSDSPQASGQLFELLYRELHDLARNHHRREAPGHTLPTTGLLHEAWFRMVAQTRTPWRNRRHFMAVASTMMRRILVDHEQARRTAKRDAERVPLTLADLDRLSTDRDDLVVAVHESLLALEVVDARAAKVVELRFFGGLEVEEVAATLEISTATVKRDWAFARAWLLRELGADPLDRGGA